MLCEETEQSGTDIREAYKATLKAQDEKRPETSSNMRPEDESYTMDRLVQRAKERRKEREETVAKAVPKDQYDILAVGIGGRGSLLYLLQKNDEAPRWTTKSHCPRSTEKKMDDMKLMWAVNKRCTQWPKFPGLTTCYHADDDEEEGDDGDVDENDNANAKGKAKGKARGKPNKAKAKANANKPKAGAELWMVCECNLSFHRTCYGVAPKAKINNWFCPVCQRRGRETAEAAQEE